jgi:RNA polymerase sigma-70 factor, ECF subfamily
MSGRIRAVAAGGCLFLGNSPPSGSKVIAGAHLVKRVGQPTKMGGHDPEIRQDYEAFVQAFARHEPGLRAFVRPLVATWDDLEEVIQQTCLVLWRKFAEFEAGTDFQAWACTIARFEVLKHRRRQARDRHVFGEELLALLADEGAEESARRDRERRALDACLERLPPRQRELLKHCYSGSRTIKEVAESLGRSATSLYKALDRIRQALLGCIEGTLGQEAAP